MNSRSPLTLSRSRSPVQTGDSGHPQAPIHAPLLHAVIESLTDGILIVTEQGQVIHANTSARQICRQCSPEHAPNMVPPQIWCICESLIERRSSFPDQIITVEDEIATNCPVPIRVRVRWLSLRMVAQPCLLVTLEDRYQSARKRAIAEVQQYGLTPREAEVWLLRRANYTYEEIAQKLYIALNTVKKHMKSIHAKRQDAINNRMPI
jgi:DNA-binding CsgD family transcriptional regulator